MAGYRASVRNWFARPMATCLRSRPSSRNAESPGGLGRVTEDGVRRLATRPRGAAGGGGLDVGPHDQAAAWPRAR